MENAIPNANEKLDEAHFYLSLMDKIETSRTSFTKDRGAEQEFSYLLSAFLNACYSTTEYLKQNQKLIEKVKSFRAFHPDFYESSKKGGLRNRATHQSPVKPSHDGYIPPPLKNVILRFRREDDPYVPPKLGEPIAFGPGNFYLSNENPQNSICDLCAIHLGEIKKLIEQCGAL